MKWTLNCPKSKMWPRRKKRIFEPDRLHCYIVHSDARRSAAEVVIWKMALCKCVIILDILTFTRSLFYSFFRSFFISFCGRFHLLLVTNFDLNMRNASTRATAHCNQLIYDKGLKWAWANPCGHKYAYIWEYVFPLSFRTELTLYGMGLFSMLCVPSYPTQKITLFCSNDLFTL